MIAWWQVEVGANAAISVAYFAIAALILIPTIRARQLGVNKLATATGAIFFSCAVGRAMHALLPTIVMSGSTPDVVAALSTWWTASWHVLTACVAVYYLSLRRSYGRLLFDSRLFDDLAARKRTDELEELAAESAARADAEAERDAYATMLSSIFENSQSAIQVKDLEGRYLMANPRVEEITGRSEAELLGQTSDFVHPDLAPLWQQHELRAREGPYRVEEWNDNFPDGRHFFDSMRFPLFDANGELYATCGVSHDVTEERRAVAAAAVARDVAVAAVAAKSTFLATMSHEIRTPMNAVIGMTDLLLHTDLDEQQIELLDTVRSSGDALMSVINDILDYSKIDAGELRLEFAPLNLRTEIERCLDVVVTAATAKGLELACQVAADCPREVVGDVLRLRQIMTNLLSNAVKFTESGEVLLTVESQPLADGRIELIIKVIDTGIGVPAEGIERIFSSFSQVDASTTRVYGGTGLGLAISRRLAEAMNGAITATSTPGVGSTFTVTLTLDSAPDVEQPKPAAAMLAGKTVLLVDDNTTNLRILESQLTDLGLRCHATTSPEAALASVRDGFRYDVAVLDMRMPGMSGVELSAALRGLPDTVSAPHILLTSLGTRSSRLGDLFAAFLTKPVKRAALKEVVSTVLGTREQAAPRVAAPVDVEPAEPLASLRILLAEDNPVNQRVAQLMIGQLGLDVDIVDNGQEAVVAVAHGSYDLVLMDVQMPKMDGLEATRRIRAQDRTRQPHIAAMTANAQLEDRTACADAGMDSYLSKPVRAAELRRLLVDVGQSLPSSSACDEEPAIDPDVFRDLMEQLDDHNSHVRDELIASYLTDSRGDVDRLVAAVQAGDSATTAAMAHTLRSISALLGASALAELLRRTEQAAADSCDDALPPIEQITSEYARVVDSLTSLASAR